MRHGGTEGGGGLPPPQHHHKRENDAKLGERRGVWVVTERPASTEKMIQARGKKNASKAIRRGCIRRRVRLKTVIRPILNQTQRLFGSRLVLRSSDVDDPPFPTGGTAPCIGLRSPGTTVRTIQSGTRSANAPRKRSLVSSLTSTPQRIKLLHRIIFFPPVMIFFALFLIKLLRLIF